MTAKAFCVLSLPTLGLLCVSPVTAVPTHLAEPAVHSAGPLPNLDKPNWRTFTSPEGRFSLLVPSTPITRARRLHTGGVLLRQFVCRAGAEIFILQYVDRPASQTELLSAEEILTIRDTALLKVSPGVLKSKRRLTLSGYPGHEIVILRANGKKETQRTYLVGARAYTLALVQPQPLTVTEAADADKFFNSFALLSAGDYDRVTPYGWIK